MGQKMSLTSLHFLTCTCLLLLFGPAVWSFDLTILHDNDVHGRVEQMDRFGGKCSQQKAADGVCYGGEARRATVVREIRTNNPNVLLLEAGDRFTGTVWFSYYEGEASAIFMNRLEYDATSFGNHEFDLGIKGLVPYLDNLTVPVVAANMDISREPRLAGKFNKSRVIEVGGKNVGIIGYVTPETASISNAGSTITFLAEIPAIQAEVDVLKASGSIDIVIALGHSGYVKDQQIAREVDGLDIVVGGHTNTFLYTGDPPSTEKPVGPYPTVVTQTSGRTVLVVQDFAWAKYLGYLNVTFDDTGEITGWSGNPILLDNSTVEDADTLTLVNQLAEPLRVLTQEVVGRSAVYLQGEREKCRLEECNLGNLITDAMVDYHVNFLHPNTTWAPASISVANGGGIRNPIAKGEITNGHILTTLPFRNTIDKMSIAGRFLREAFEHSVENYDPVTQEGKFLQVSGLRVKYNLLKPNGQRVVSVHVRCLQCEVPSFSALQDDEIYNVMIPGFLANGGDGYSMFKNNRTALELFNSLDADVLRNYLQKMNPVYQGLEDRIQFVVTDNCSVSRGSKRVLPSSGSVILTLISSILLLPFQI